MARLPTGPEARTAARLAVLLLLAAVGALLLTDRPGLRAEYFALEAPWQGKPICTSIGAPGLANASEIHEYLVSEVGFSVRWRGRWRVVEPGEHHFAVAADDGAYLKIDGELVAERGGVFGKRKSRGTAALEAGLHDIEVGLYQTHGESRLAIQWMAPGQTAESAAALPVSALVAQRPFGIRLALRSALAASVPQPYRRFLGAVLLLAAAMMLRGLGFLSKAGEWLRNRFRSADGPRLRAAFLFALFVMSFVAALPSVGTVRGGDDTAYLDAAYFGLPTGFYARYVHLYLLKFFVFVGGSDATDGVRLWWSFIFAGTVTSLAIAVRSIGPGLQLRTLGVTLFVLLSQTTLFGLAGNAFADFSAMLFVTAAVAAFMVGLGTGEERERGHDWNALVVGALTAAACWSKEVSGVLLLLPLLYLIGPNGFDVRRFMRRGVYWMAGVLGLTAGVILLDGLVLGNFFLHFDPGRLSQLKQSNFIQALPSLRNDEESWFHVVWTSRTHAASLSLRNVGIGVAAAAIAAGVRGRRLELRLLHLLPIVYLGALIFLYIRLPHPVSERMLIPFLPVACLMAGLLAHYAGLDEIAWKRLLAPRVLIPVMLAAFVLFLFVIPYRMGRLEAAEFLPVAVLRGLGWTPELFAIGVLLPALVLAGLSCASLFASSRRVRVAALLVAFLAFFGLGVDYNLSSLHKRWSWQAGALLLHPWNTFRSELEASPPNRVVLSKDVGWRYRMTAATRTALARIALRRQDIGVSLTSEVPVDADAAIASRMAYRKWQQELPALEKTASFDAAGVLVLVRPKEAVKEAASGAKTSTP